MEPDAAPTQTGDGSGPRAIAVFGSFRYGQYFEDLLAGIMSAADAVGGSVISVQTSAGVLPSSDETGGQLGVNRAAWDHFGAAIVILQSVSRDYVAQLRAAGTFVVAIGQDLRGAHASIAIDNAGGVRDAVTHLVGHGHSVVGFLAPDWQVDAVERYEAYCDRMVELGLAPQERLGRGLSRELTMDEQGFVAAQEFAVAYRAGRRVTAVLAGTDLIALGFIRGLHDAGLSVPDDVAVVGIDDVDQAAVSVPPLATVAISFERVGQIAYEVAARGAAGQEMSPRHVVPQRLVPRESCGCASGGGGGQGLTLSSPIAVFAARLVDAAQQSALQDGVDVARVERAAQGVVALLSAGHDGNPQRSPEHIACEINELCPLDRSVQSALRAVRSLAQAMAEGLRGGDASRVWALSAATLDLCDAIRSGQLQRRMTEYVDLKRMQNSHYFIGNSLLSHDREELRSLSWLSQTPADAGALGLWSPPEQSTQMGVAGVYDRRAGRTSNRHGGEPIPIESFPPAWMLRADAGGGRLVVLSQVRFEDSDWGVLAVAGGQVLQSALVQETFQQWAILMSASLDQERADADLARQAEELRTAYETEMALVEEVRVSEERYALAAEATRDALWDWDIATGEVFYSSSWKALLGHRDHEIGTTAKEWLDRVHPDDQTTVRDQLERARDGQTAFVEFEHRLRDSSGEYRWIDCHGRTVAAEGGRPLRLVGSISDVTARRLLQEELLQEARFDPLTGLLRTPAFKERLQQAIEGFRCRPERLFAVLFVDLDGFKAVNDTLGHAAGDELLASVARRLEGSLRKNDSAARLGGDEFAVLLTEVDHVGELPPVLERLRSLIATPHEVSGPDR